MEIKDILSKLGIDFSNPDAKRGALEAIDAILSSRIDVSGLSGGDSGLAGSGGEVEVEIDPDLLQPSVKHSPKGGGGDFEVEDEEKLLDKVKHNKSEDPEEAPTETQGEQEEQSDQGSSEQTNNSETPTTANSNGSESELEVDSEQEGESEAETEAEIDAEAEGEFDEFDEFDDEEAEVEAGETDDELFDPDAETTVAEVEGEEEAEEEFPDEQDWLDDDTKNATQDKGINSKTEARKIKRERTLQAAKNALTKANERGASKALIKELESAIAALEALTEAAKHIADVSDEEFNQLVNRVFDAIDALGTGDLSYSSDEERQAKAQEIKADLASGKTQADLSAEDAAVIRAETQAIKAREKEADKYKPKSRSSFQGLSAFMDSLQRGIALQVSYEEERDDTWSAISRRNSGDGILRQGQKINELPNKKVPIIDFYFDQSGSWGADDIEVGNKAVEALAKMQEDGKIKINIYYFSNHVHTDAASARAEGGTRAWNDIVKNVIATEASNVVIMTDSDMEDWWEGPKALSYTVAGFVWYLWRNGDNAPRLPRDLKGRGGTMQYSF